MESIRLPDIAPIIVDKHLILIAVICQSAPVHGSCLLCAASKLQALGFEIALSILNKLFCGLGKAMKHVFFACQSHSEKVLMLCPCLRLQF